MTKLKQPTRGVRRLPHPLPCHTCGRAAILEYRAKRYCIFCWRTVPK